MILGLSIIGFVIAIIPAAMFIANLPLFTEVVSDLEETPRSSISVLIPARDEEDGIGECLRCALASEGVDLEVVVLDDDSQDATAEIVHQLCESDRRLRCLTGKPLPQGWNGKQHACMHLAEAARYDHFVFLDADVRLQPDALAKLLSRMRQTDVDLLSAFPHQETKTWLEQWIIPMMHYILLGFLPLRRMRESTSPAYAAGCGQLFLTTREAYLRAGTHQAIRGSRHDGVKLPRVYRQADLRTDVIDGTDLAACRMYRSATEVVHGVLKNAVEGIANPKLILLFSILLIGSSVLPVVMLVWSIIDGNLVAMVVSIMGVLIGHLPRAMAADRFRQPWFGVLCHSAATLLFVTLQWIALLNHLLGRKVAWRGRTES